MNDPIDEKLLSRWQADKEKYLREWIRDQRERLQDLSERLQQQEPKDAEHR